MFKTMRSFLLAFLVSSLVMVGAVSAQESTPIASPVASPVATSGLEGAVTWLLQQQQPDGSFLGMSGDADAGTTVDAIIALAAADAHGVDVGDAIERAVAWLESGDVALVYTQTGVGQSAKLVLGLTAAGKDLAAIANVNPAAILAHGQNAETGLYGTGLYDHAYTVLALVATGQEVPATAISYIESTQAENGAWAWDGSTDIANTDSNTTSMIVQALVAAGQKDSETVQQAIAYLESTVSDAGVAYAAGGEADANSTAVVLQAFIAAGQDTTALEAALPTFQNANGSFFWMASDTSDNLFSTVQAIPALAQVALPIMPVAITDRWAA